MEIRDPIHGPIELTPMETAVVDNEYFQRLRNIKQLGFTEFSFPGATHNRYCHSLGAMSLAGRIFDHLFQGYHFENKENGWRFRQTVKLAALLHDVGHGPLSHTSEEVMPALSALKIKLYAGKKDRRANHEDYTVKIITDSSLTDVLISEFKDLQPEHIAQLIDKSIVAKDDFFHDGGLNFRPLLSQLVSSELDCDRMDYLARDSYYCGTTYGHVDSEWLMANLTYHVHKDAVYLAVNRRALYTFDDFLIARYHMYLMVYFHHKGIVYDEMLLRYLRSKDCDFALPADIKKYVEYDDYKLHLTIGQSKNKWAQMISQRKPYRMLFETHDEKKDRVSALLKRLEDENIDVVHASSTGRLSKYYDHPERGEPIFVIERDQGPKVRISKIEESTQIFERYQNARRIERVYVEPNKYSEALELLK